jgi:hypothetical protein
LLPLKTILLVSGYALKQTALVSALGEDRSLAVKTAYPMSRHNYTYSSQKFYYISPLPSIIIYNNLLSEKRYNGSMAFQAGSDKGGLVHEMG